MNLEFSQGSCDHFPPAPLLSHNQSYEYAKENHVQTCCGQRSCCQGAIVKVEHERVNGLVVKSCGIISISGASQFTHQISRDEIMQKDHLHNSLKSNPSKLLTILLTMILILPQYKIQHRFTLHKLLHQHFTTC